MSRPSRVLARPSSARRSSVRWTARTLAGALVLVLSGVLGAPALHAQEPGTDPAPAVTSDDAGAATPTADPEAGVAVDPVAEETSDQVPDPTGTDETGDTTPTDAADPADPADPSAPTGGPSAAQDGRDGTSQDEPLPSVAGVGQVTDLTLAVVSDGTANSDGSWDATDDPGQDSSPTNGIVRTHDSVVYRWGYSVAQAGDITVTQALPDGMSWVAA